MKLGLRRMMAEPLCQFMILGALIFLLYGLFSSQAGGGSGTIVVTQGKIDHLISAFIGVRQRPPSDEELRGLIQDYIREEVLYREAMELGLDRDDTIIRRRLRQKMEFMAADMTAQPEPTDADLQAYMSAHAKSFMVEPRFSFRQVYLDPQKRRATLTRDIESTLAELRTAGSKADTAARGDSSLMEGEFDDVSSIELQKVFGTEFVEQLAGLALGSWQGPVSSGYGAHLVLVNQRTPAYVPRLAEVRDRVRREWADARQLEAREKSFQQMLKRYDVVIEQPHSTGGGERIAEARP